jgi:hypothetical protein
MCIFHFDVTVYNPTRSSHRLPSTASLGRQGNPLKTHSLPILNVALRATQIRQVKGVTANKKVRRFGTDHPPTIPAPQLRQTETQPQGLRQKQVHEIVTRLRETDSHSQWRTISRGCRKAEL